MARWYLRLCYFDQKMAETCSIRKKAIEEHVQNLWKELESKMGEVRVIKKEVFKSQLCEEVKRIIETEVVKVLKQSSLEGKRDDDDDDKVEEREGDDIIVLQGPVWRSIQADYSEFGQVADLLTANLKAELSRMPVEDNPVPSEDKLLVVSY